MRLLLSGLCLLLLSVGTSVHARDYGELSFEPCMLGTKGGQMAVQALCGKMQVPEDRANPDGRKIMLSVAWVPSSNAKPQKDPMIFIAGGPGQSALDSYPQIHHALTMVRANRHVVLMDQRGTGGSNLLSCGKDFDAEAILSETDGALDDAKLKEAVDACMVNVNKNADPRFYTTTEAIADLEAFRKMLGAPAWNMLGVSYGTRVVQQFAKTYPDAVRTIILDGVAPNEVMLGSDHARFLDAALDRYLTACNDPKICGKVADSNRARLKAISQKLKAEPVTVRFRHGITGKWQTETINHEHVGMVMRMFSYSPTTAATLPLLIDQMEAGQFDTIAALSHMTGDQMEEAIAMAMSLTVTCSEDTEGMRTNNTDAHSVLGKEFVDQIQRICALWPKGKMPADYHKPLVSDAPALVLSGEYDPVTPPSYGDMAAKHLSAGKHIIAPGQGHFVSGVGCMPKIIGDFVIAADTAELKTECIERLKPMPIFVDLYGPQP